MTAPNAICGDRQTIESMKLILQEVDPSFVIPEVQLQIGNDNCRWSFR